MKPVCGWCKNGKLVLVTDSAGDYYRCKTCGKWRPHEGGGTTR